ncbi:serine hydrolase [Bifidobacterium miconisargentati]|uniref:serine hydrolase n=1 Tax=Bifidobacterium miconisargentati TaxID=2834437 RepID=UPI001BDBF392|nr:serine hydrolase [Bifidobacterium miconisargentati]MBW3089282.1 serine hydrolase [Bifidobacterium miconisargentati]
MARHQRHRAPRPARSKAVTIGAAVAVVAVIVALAVTFGWWLPNRRTAGGDGGVRSSQTLGTTSATSGTSAAADAATSATAGKPTHGTLDRESTPRPDTRDLEAETRITNVKSALESTMPASGGTWSAYVENLDTGKTVSLNEQPMVAASEIKLYVMLAVYDRLASGTLNTGGQNTDTLLNQMITVSSNAATNQLVQMIGDGDMATGINRVTETAAKYGYASSKQLRALSDAGTDGTGTENWTSSADCGKLLAAIYRGELVSPEASQAMLGLLEGQTRRNKIPSGLPAGVQVANKTGELAGVENDAAIIWGKASDGSARDYVLVVMTSGVNSTTAQQAIIEASSAVYAAMTS